MSTGRSCTDVKKFTSFLGRDGYLIQRLVSWASSELVAAEMVAGAYDVFEETGGKGKKSVVV